MIDEMTQKRVVVSNDEDAGPYLMVTLDQLDVIREALDRHKVRYWVDGDAISLDNEPPVTWINFGKMGQAARIKAILNKIG
jgi:hypothetical protein